MRSTRLCAIALASAVACGCSGVSNNPKNSSTPPPSDILSVAVNAGPNGDYANGLFAAVTICASGSSNCQTINGVLVDTGSFGLRLLYSALNSTLANALAQEKSAGGNSIVECAEFSDGITWGPVVTADVKIAGEKAPALPVQIIGNPSFASVPSNCSKAGAAEDTLQTLGANGILGIGNFVQDCPACEPGGSSNPGLYYGCSGSACQVITVSLSQQVANPVASFGTDSNGVVVQLPTASATTTALAGNLIFGIGTQSDNALGSAKLYTIDSSTGNFASTTFEGKSYAGFLDTGSNGYFFSDSSTTGIPACPSPESGFYCPSSTQTLSATNTGANNTSSTVSFKIDNASSLFSGAAADSVFPTLGGPLSGMFDWGLPFFYGRSVYVAIEGAPTPAGSGPYWAY
jgi:hypothetical protein